MRKQASLMEIRPSEATVKDESTIWRRCWVSCIRKLTTAVAAINECRVSEAIFLIMVTLLTLLATLPVTTYEVEKMFRKVPT